MAARWTPVRPALGSVAVRRQQKHQIRLAHDLAIKATTGRPIVAQGPGGRHSTTGHVATVFGCTGFLGRYLVHKLAKKGTQVVVPYRVEDSKRHLRPMGDLGQIVPLEFDLRNDTQIEECIRHSDVVYNLVGRDYETKNFSYTDVSVEGARRIARIASLTGVSRLIQVSHINADHNSKSKFYRAKAEGEEAVKEAFPGATIVRPAPMFGHEDRLLNKMVTRPWSFRVNDLETTISPVSVLDVAEAMQIMLDAESTTGTTFSLPGPETFTYDSLFALVEALTYRKLRGGVQIPKFVLQSAARVWENIWWPTISPDEIARRYIDEKEPELGTLGFNYLGMEPATVRDTAIAFLRHYRPSIFFSEPMPSSGRTLKPKAYKVIH